MSTYLSDILGVTRKSKIETTWAGGREYIVDVSYLYTEGDSTPQLFETAHLLLGDIKYRLLEGSYIKGVEVTGDKWRVVTMSGSKEIE